MHDTDAAGPLVVYGEPLPVELTAIVREALPAGCRLTIVGGTDRAELLRLVPEAEFLVVATARVDAPLLAAAPHLRLVQHQGVGYDNIDVGACHASGVTVALTPEGTSVGVAEHTILLILALYKRLYALETDVRDGGWPVWDYRSSSFELAGKMLGLVGFGRIGREVARRARAFDATIGYADPVAARAEVEAALGVTRLTLDELLRRSDIVSLHLPATAGTRHLIGTRELALLRPGALLINTARGALVDEAALAAALRDGRLAGAGLDVLAQEPPPADHPLRRLDRVVLTPHVAAGTQDAFHAKMRAIGANVGRVMRGEPALHVVQTAC